MKNRRACTHCGVRGFHDELGYVVQKPFCYECCAILDALRIGNPATKQITAYTNSDDKTATNWAGRVLGHITRETRPQTRSSLQPVRFQVRMLDGSMWYGTGPAEMGNYVNLRRYKGN